MNIDLPLVYSDNVVRLYNLQQETKWHYLKPTRFFVKEMEQGFIICHGTEDGYLELSRNKLRTSYMMAQLLWDKGAKGLYYLVCCHPQNHKKDITYEGLTLRHIVYDIEPNYTGEITTHLFKDGEDYYLGLN